MSATVITPPVTVTTKNTSTLGGVRTACPLGLVNDPYPGECRWYVDANANGICDLSEPELVASGAVIPPPDGATAPSGSTQQRRRQGQNN